MYYYPLDWKKRSFSEINNYVKASELSKSLEFVFWTMLDCFYWQVEQMYPKKWENAYLALDNELTILIYTPWQELQEIRSLKNKTQK